MSIFINEESEWWQTLKLGAWNAEFSDDMPLHVHHWITELPSFQTPTMYIAPCCGSAYHEWRVFLHLIHTGALASPSHMVLMDNHIDDVWLLIWHRLADKYNVNLTVLHSYTQLAELTNNHAVSLDCALVLYINGSFIFSTFTCQDAYGIEESRKGAVRFWTWCERHAVSTPINFLFGEPMNPASCCSWSALVDLFNGKVASALKLEPQEVEKPKITAMDHDLDRTAQ